MDKLTLIEQDALKAIKAGMKVDRDASEIISLEQKGLIARGLWDKWGDESVLYVPSIPVALKAEEFAKLVQA